MKMSGLAPKFDQFFNKMIAKQHIDLTIMHKDFIPTLTLQQLINRSLLL
jgi:hypothetical protein